MVDKIKELRKTLKDPTTSVEDHRFAQWFIIHCVEDLHVPMHVGDNRDWGGNDTQVKFFDRGTNMHSLWDGGLLARTSDKEDCWLKELTVLPSAQCPDKTGGDGRGLAHGIVARSERSLHGPCNG